MKISQEELVSVLSQFNPWWRGEGMGELPAWRRAAFRELYGWLAQAWAPRQYCCRAREPATGGAEYLFLDEAQFIRDWGTWVKHQVDFNKTRRIAFTRSAMPMLDEAQESGVGRWHTIRLSTLSFFEYLQIKQLALPRLPALKTLRDLFRWQSPEFARTGEIAKPYVAHL